MIKKIVLWSCISPVGHFDMFNHPLQVGGIFDDNDQQDMVTSSQATWHLDATLAQCQWATSVVPTGPPSQVNDDDMVAPSQAT